MKTPIRSFVFRLLVFGLVLCGGAPGIYASSPTSRMSLPEDLLTIVGDSALLRKPENLTVACYTFPNYHPSAFHNKLYAPGWTEYNLTRVRVRGTKTCPTPYTSSRRTGREPSVDMETYNELCKDSGIDVLIWDWYWYDGKPCLHEALENGFLESRNCGDVKFACMWTNHPWYILYPTKLTNGYTPIRPVTILRIFRMRRHSGASLILFRVIAIWRTTGGSTINRLFASGTRTAWSSVSAWKMRSGCSGNSKLLPVRWVTRGFIITRRDSTHRIPGRWVTVRRVRTTL